MNFFNIAIAKKEQQRQSGNVLFLILIAVALFATLSYVVTQSTRSGGGNVSNEKMQLGFDAVLNHVTALRSAFTRMSISGISPVRVNARYPLPAGTTESYGYHVDNTLCPAAGTDNSCKLYHPQGGGAIFFDFAALHPELSGGIPASPGGWRAAFLGWSWCRMRQKAALAPRKWILYTPYGSPALFAIILTEGLVF